jgi:ketosteroid isomerase-like protein
MISSADMRSFTVGLILLCSSLLVASDDALLDQLKAVHSQWIKAFDAGDGVAMDRIEMPNLVLVMPDGVIWHKTPRAGIQKPTHMQHELESITVRPLGDTAILNGILVTRTEKGITKEASTVVFVRDAGVWKIASAQWTAITK